ncbi:hypothetical protein FRC04_002082 [Tulasnella sp. 424]|nr:hypothetical protein FRC04_002082 [Tulasnella sp. 424]KAG8968002.1 hypothetical protein FRC05_001712 [Tulasnella sp. 425]
MTEPQAYTFKDAVNRLRQAPDDSDHIHLAEEAIELAVTAYEVDAVTNIFWSRYPRIRQLMARARTRRDSLRGSSQLPDEVLIEIIRVAASNPKIDQRTQLLSDPTLFNTLNSYRRVCKRWKFLIDGSSTLWAFLSADRASTRVFRRAVARSGDAPVVISYGAGKMDWAQFVDMAIPHMHRCKALWMKADKDSDLPTLLSLLDKPSPSLEELHVYLPFAGAMAMNIDGIPEFIKTSLYLQMEALRSNMQRIRALSLDPVVEWDSTLKLANLRELKLHRPSFPAMHLIECIAEAPLLQSLVIEDPVFQRTSDKNEILGGFAVELAFLTRIELQAVTPSFAHATLSKITPPSLKELIIALTICAPAFSLDNIGPDYRGLVHSLMESQGSLPIPIRVENQIQRLALFDPETRRHFELSGVHLFDRSKPHCAQCIRDLIRGWKSRSDPSFTLEFGPMTNSQADDYWTYVPPNALRALMEIEGVSKIQVGPGFVHVGYLYDQLSRPVVHGADQSQRWLLPKLAILEIEGQDDADDGLARMLKDRYAAAAAPDGDNILPRPFSMVKLVRDYGREPEPTIAAEVRNIIGEERLCIEMF